MTHINAFTPNYKVDNDGKVLTNAPGAADASKDPVPVGQATTGEVKTYTPEQKDKLDDAARLAADMVKPGADPSSFKDFPKCPAGIVGDLSFNEIYQSYTDDLKLWATNQKFADATTEADRNQKIVTLGAYMQLNATYEIAENPELKGLVDMMIASTVDTAGELDMEKAIKDTVDAVQGMLNQMPNVAKARNAFNTKG